VELKENHRDRLTPGGTKLGIREGGGGSWVTKREGLW